MYHDLTFRNSRMMAMLEVFEAARVGGGSDLFPEPPTRGNSMLVCDQCVI